MQDPNDKMRKLVLKVEVDGLSSIKKNTADNNNNTNGGLGQWTQK